MVRAGMIVRQMVKAGMIVFSMSSIFTTVLLWNCKYLSGEKYEDFYETVASHRDFIVSKDSPILYFPQDLGKEWTVWLHRPHGKAWFPCP
jgi:hypothetical protein